MNATIELSDNRQFLNLLHAVFAIHDRYTHDRDVITFHRDDRFTLRVNFSLNYVSFGRESAPETECYWTENITIGQIDELLHLFIRNQDAKLRRFRWLMRPAPSRKSKRRPARGNNR